jgi:GT2 family glycosyltransferase
VVRATTTGLSASSDNEKKPAVSVIIAHTRFSVNKTLDSLSCQKMPADSFEVILVGDQADQFNADDYQFILRYVKCSRLNPSRRRNLGIEAAAAEIYAFIDDDAQAAPDWLSNAIELFEGDEKLAVLGGPTYLPENSSLGEKLTYKISHAGFFGNGHENLECDSNDFDKVFGYIICCNMFIHSQRLDGNNGFSIAVGYGGEDTLFLYQIQKKGKCKILYSISLVVYHSRGAYGIRYLSFRFWYRVNNGMMIWVDPMIYFRNKKFAIGVSLASVVLLTAVFMPLTALLFAAFHQTLSLIYSTRYLKEDPRLTFLFPPALLLQHGVYYAGIVTGLFSVLNSSRRTRIKLLRKALHVNQ